MKEKWKKEEQSFPRKREKKQMNKVEKIFKSTHTIHIKCKLSKYPN